MVGERIRMARFAARMRLRDVTERLESRGHKLSVAAMSRMENGDLRVSAELMQKLADLLGVTPAWFLQESPKIDWIGYRKASRMTAVDRDHIEAIAVVVVEHHLRLNQLLKRDYPVSEAGIPVATGEDAERAAVEVRNRLGLGRLPIHSMAGLFEETGGIIVECSCPGKQFDGRAGTVAGRPVVVLDADRSDDRPDDRSAPTPPSSSVGMTNPSGREPRGIGHFTRFSMALFGQRDQARKWSICAVPAIGRSQ